jgi:hypothetical protein
MDWWDKEPQWDPPVNDNNSVLSISVGGLNYDLVKVFANGTFIGEIIFRMVYYHVAATVE